MANKDRYPPEVRAMLHEALRHARSGKGNRAVLQQIGEEAERIRKRILKKHGVLNIGVPAIRALRNSQE